MKTLVNIMIVLALLVCVGSAQGALLVDQQQLINDAPSDMTGTGVAGKVQGFTPSVNRIDGVEVYFDSWGAGPNTNAVLDIEIYNCIGGSNTLPDWDAGVLGQGTTTLIFATELQGWKEILLDSPAALVPGNNYSIVMRSDSQQRIRLGRDWTSPGNPYVGGGYASWLSGETNGTAVYGDVFEDDKLDMTFKTLYLPEPATLLVLLAGAGLAVARRRR